MSIGDLKNRSRLALHKALSFPAIAVDLDAQTQTVCSIRVHHRTDAFGDMTGFDYAPAERLITVPEVVVLASEITPKRGHVFSVAADEAYVVETPLPRDGLTITAQCTRMSQTEIDAAALPVPVST